MIFILSNTLKDRLLTLPMVFVTLGIVFFSFPLDLPVINPQNNFFDRQIIEFLTEFIIIISLCAIGIKIDRRPSWKSWKVGVYLIGIAMPLTIIILACLGYYFLGLGLGAAILLGSILSPTDPVLAGNVQVKPPNSGDGHDVRFALTLEAGLNDGLAFPFVYLAMIAEEDGLNVDSFLSWLSYEFLYKIIAGVVMGYILGKILVAVFFLISDRINSDAKSEISEALFLIGATLLTYGSAEVVNGYGFLAVFVAAVTARQTRRSHPLHNLAYKAIVNVEQTLLCIFLFVFGGTLTSNGIAELSWKHIAVAVLLIFLIRPLVGMISFSRFKASIFEKFIISFFGIRGIGTIYYLSFAQNQIKDFKNINELWLVASCCIIISIVVHGLAAKFLIPKLEESN